MNVILKDHWSPLGGEGATLLIDRRSPLLPFIVAAHLAVFWLWPKTQHDSPGTRRGYVTEIFFIPLPAKKSPAVVPLLLPPPLRPVPRYSAPKAITPLPQESAVGRPAPETPGKSETVVESDAISAAPAAPAESTLQRARRMAGDVDKQLRKESWNPRDKNIVQDQSKLARDIASAFKAQSTTFEEITTADGRRMTKIHTPGGTYCGELQSNALTGGRDPFKDGVKTQYHTCPN